MHCQCREIYWDPYICYHRAKNKYIANMQLQCNANAMEGCRIFVDVFPTSILISNLTTTCLFHSIVCSKKFFIRHMYVNCKWLLLLPSIYKKVVPYVELYQPRFWISPILLLRCSHPSPMFFFQSLIFPPFVASKHWHIKLTCLNWYLELSTIPWVIKQIITGGCGERLHYANAMKIKIKCIAIIGRDPMFS